MTDHTARCQLCRKRPVAYPQARFCGAACSQRYEAGERFYLPPPRPLDGCLHMALVLAFVLLTMLALLVGLGFFLRWVQTPQYTEQPK